MASHGRCDAANVIAASGRGTGDPRVEEIKLSQCVRALQMHPQQTDMLGFRTCPNFVSAVSPFVDGLRECDSTTIDRECDKIRGAFDIGTTTSYCKAIISANNDFWDDFGK